MPFGEIGKDEYGTSSSATAHRGRHRADAANMFIGDPPGNTDHILEFSTAIMGGKFFTPIVDFSTTHRRFRIRSLKKRTRSHRRARPRQRVAGDRAA